MKFTVALFDIIGRKIQITFSNNNEKCRSVSLLAFMISSENIFVNIFLKYRVYFKNITNYILFRQCLI